MPTAALDEGIVQPAAKAAELLSPRLHQLMVPGRSAGDLFFKSCGQISTNTQLLRILLQTSAGHITNKRRELAHHSPSFAYTLSSRQPWRSSFKLQTFCARTKRDVRIYSSRNICSSLLAMATTIQRDAPRRNPSSGDSLQYLHAHPTSGVTG